jgi:S1-C subfamily serine protease
MNEPNDRATGPIEDHGSDSASDPELRWTPDQSPDYRPPYEFVAAPAEPARSYEPAPWPDTGPAAPPIFAPVAPPPVATPPAGQWSAWTSPPQPPQPFAPPLAYEAIAASRSHADRADVARADGSGGRRLVPLIVATALLSATLSAVGTFAAFTLVPRAASVASGPASGTPQAQVVSLTQSEAIVRVAQAAKASVVTISTTGTAALGRRAAQFTGSGSGFIVSADGLIVTNNHVVMDTSTLTVTLDGGKELPATIVTTDATHDLALIRVQATGLTPLPLGDSAAVKVGQLAIAIGSPLGTFTDSVTQGIVSGLDRAISVGDSTSNFTENLTGLIQTDAAINPGNSGGPLLDAGGSVIGVVTAASGSAQDIGFAVPVDQVKAMIASAR